MHGDKNRNGVIERKVVITDNEMGGKMAIIYTDIDEDGRFDKRGIDSDFDGRIEDEEQL